MATEKTWECRHNIVVSDTDDATTGANWMFEFYNFLSGGVGTVGKWEILSASAGSGSVGGGSLLSSSHQFNWSATNRTWWVCRKDILPVTASVARYIYLTVDLNQADDKDAYWIFDYEAPNFTGKATNSRPAETANAYEITKQYRLPYDAANDTYFHGTIDLTGSFVTVTSQNNVSYANYQSSIACCRIETPRAPEIDPFPIFLKVAYADSTNYQGAWTYGEGGAVGNASTTIAAGLGTGYTNYAKWSGVGGQAVWSVAGIPDNSYGRNCSFMHYCGAAVTANSVFLDLTRGGSVIDGTFPLLAGYIWEANYGSTSVVRGRVPDFHPGSGEGNDGFSGMTTPATGTPTHCVVGSWWLPFTASLLPGENN